MPDSTSPTAVSSTSPREVKSLPTLLTELWELILSYVKQQTVEPVKDLWKFLGWGVPGAFITSLGVLLLVLAGLRAIETETSFQGHLSWLPYVIVVAGAGVVAALSARAVTRPARKKGR
jgi:hypothetical protein